MGPSKKYINWWMVACSLLFIIAYHYLKSPATVTHHFKQSTVNDSARSKPLPISQNKSSNFVTRIIEKPKADPAKQDSAPKQAQAQPPKTLDYEIQADGLVVTFGDIVLGAPKSEKMAMHGVIAPPVLKLWDTTEIPYHIQPTVKNPERILQALENFNSTPISFVPYQSQADAIVFEPGLENCKSYLGQVGGLQPIWISEDCDTPELTHEIMHALGFIHEQSRTDRDSFIEILFDNIDDKYKSQFAMVPQDLMLPLIGTTFDYQSVMLYNPSAFAKQVGLKTLRSKNTNEILPANGLSKQDIERLIKVYSAKQ